MVAAVRQKWANGAADTNCVILHKRASGRRNCAKRQELFCYGCQVNWNEETNVTWTSKVFASSKGKSLFALFREGDFGGDNPLNFPPYSHIQVAVRCMVAAVRQTWADGAADTNCVILHKRASGRRNCAKRQELFCYGCQMSRNEETNVTWTSKVP